MTKATGKQRLTECYRHYAFPELFEVLQLEFAAYGKGYEAERHCADDFYVAEIGFVYEIEAAGTYKQPRNEIACYVGKPEQLDDT